MTIKILILDSNRYYQEGLKHCLKSHYKNKGLAVEIYNEIIKDFHYHLAFIDEFYFPSYLVANYETGIDTLYLIHGCYNYKILSNDSNLFLLHRKLSVSGLSSLLESTDLRMDEIPIKTLTTHLTPRELTVLQYYSLGYSNTKIAKLLGIHTKTVSIHMVNIKIKLNFNRKGDFRRWVIMNPGIFISNLD
ncbi:TPA: helix-turn-helix transcriptional regulator [Enterobacter cloacae]|nr:helix-turn-helix transcriptional regulator [Enterobacter cloacae]